MLVYFMKSLSDLCDWCMWRLIKWIGPMKLVKVYKLFI